MTNKTTLRMAAADGAAVIPDFGVVYGEQLLAVDGVHLSSWFSAAEEQLLREQIAGA